MQPSYYSGLLADGSGFETFRRDGKAPIVAAEHGNRYVQVYGPFRVRADADYITERR